MTKSLITLLGALVSIAVVALAVVFGVLPLAGQAFAAQESTTLATTTNHTYENQIAELQKQKARKSEIDASVAALRGQIPADPRLDEVFDIIGRSAQSAGVTITSAVRGDLTAFVARTAPISAGPAAAAEKKAQPAPQPTPQPTAPSGPVADANSTAKATTNAAGQTSQAGGAGTSATSVPGSAGSGRQQIPITIAVTAPDMTAVQAFLDGLRGSDRLLAVDKVTVHPDPGGPKIQIDLFAFVSPDATSGAAAK
ncbi:GspMb/PilO family protein [Microbacterium panaciterrae]|uniref:Tfp pilus assembly protein PilO n=1 Tax=Microbacterium panaciterrae TaxID=985759 RepID=A0ABP8P5B4_9MICO